MKRTDIEGRAALRFRALAQLEQLELADLVRAGLPGIGDVAVDLVRNVESRLGRVREKIGDGVVARSAEGVHPGIDDEPHGAPHVVGLRAQLCLRTVVYADLVTERFRVETPTLGVADVVRRPAEVGQRAQLVRERELQVMSRHRFV